MTVLALAVVAFAADQFLVALPGEQLGALMQEGLVYGPYVRQGEWWRVVATVFAHGNWLHLALNMSVVWTLGQTLERAIRPWRFALVSLVTALGSSLFVLLFAYQQPTLGASGMIIGYAGVMLPIATQRGRRELSTWLLQIAVISLLPGISWQGHLGGFLFGLPLGWALRGGAPRFRYAAPIVLFVVACLVVLAGAGYFAGPSPLPSSTGRGMP
ncbi:MAG: rhomboid family intramembrane serine protease [Myxococcota bacterium]